MNEIESEIRKEATFLVERLTELEWMDDGFEETSRDFFGHCWPSIERLRALLAPTPNDQEGKEG
jgi:hypothetical protein